MKKLMDDVYWVGANDWEARKFHGSELSVHHGTSYNAYLICDEKKVIIDSVWEPLTENFIDRIKEIIDLKDIDYVVANHGEPDHSGALPILLKEIPDVPVIVSQKGEQTLKRHYHEEWNFKVVHTGDKINVGKNDLIFIEAPFLHWPDSMFTYLTGKNILFPNDAFGQHYSSSALFNDEVDEFEVYQEAIKYYANILTPFSKLVTKKINELKALNLPVDMIAPSHGIIWRNNPMQIVDLYDKWAKGLNEEQVVIFYNSMWGATKKMAEYIGVGLEKSNVKYKIYNVATADRSDILTEIFQSKGILCGSSTVNNTILPTLAPLLDELKGLKYQNKIGATFGSYGWNPDGTKVLTKYLQEARINLVKEPLNINYMPNSNDLDLCVEFGEDFGKLIKQD